MEVDTCVRTRLESTAEDSVIKFSIIVPVYNVERFLRECLDSIENQTFKGFEVICINDGSTDGSLSILQEYAAKDSRFKVISQENQGQGVARNKGIDFAQGEYLLFIDSDDFVESNMLEIIYGKFQQTDADIVQFDFATCKENGKYSGTNSFKKRMRKEFKYSLKNDDLYNWNEIKIDNFQNISLAVWDKAFRMDFIKDNNIKFALNKISEDNIFTISANLLANKILYANNILYHYRTRLNSAVNKASDSNFCIFDNIELLKDFLISNNLYEKYATVFRTYILGSLVFHYELIPVENTDKYLENCKALLTSQEYAVFMQKTKWHLSILENIFSVKNKKRNGVKVKYLTILGIRIEIKR